ncbi:hypothetical protein [Ureibacillus aquaedulcis]|uniref:Uncharacterized protein n=1 Tax=Ureibacillus aquaedulcis TaxID=3058421 RepID=A0ABT8GSF2_9BACL|nr:hypothetical protein [Ureibacillus sp. BA0131]MDN4494352.1 hypothetical protein [Ureibacillus sp. BA0131]
MKAFQLVLSLLPIPFLFHLYEYNSHLARQDPVFLAPAFIFMILLGGIVMRKVKISLFFGVSILMTFISLGLGHLFIEDDGSWFKPFGRDAAVIWVAAIYIVGQLAIRGVSKMSSPL